jgi:hypothetical protein
MAVDADRRHGEGREPGIPRHAMRSQGDFGVAGAVGSSGVTLPVLARAKRVTVRPAELKSGPAKPNPQQQRANPSNDKPIQSAGSAG